MFDNLGRYKGLLIAVSCVIVFFILYLLLNAAILSKTLADVEYVNNTKNLTTQDFQSLSQTQTDSLVADLNALNQTRTLQVNGSPKEVPSISSFLNAETTEPNELIAALKSKDWSAANKLAESISSVVDRRIGQKKSLLVYLQYAAGVISVILFGLFIVPSILTLSKTEEVGATVKKEAAGIMSTVSEGLFLLSHEHEIGLEQSASLKEMFKSEKDLEGNFFDFIAQYVPQKTVQVAKDYLGLLYEDRVKEKLVRELNPLDEVEINIVRRDGSYESRFLDFKFNRVMEGERLSHILVSVTDETRRVQLERALIETKEEQEAQLDLLLSILHIDKKLLDKFFDSTEISLNEINETLESRGHSNIEVRNKINEISAVTHKVKGDAAALGLHQFEFAAHALEDELANVKSTEEAITGKDLLPAVTKLKAMFSELGTMRDLVGKFSGNLSGSKSEGVSNEQLGLDAAMSSVLKNLTQTVADRNGKRALLTTFGLDSEHIPEHLAEPIQSIATQLIRNSIVHGGNSPQERIGVGKSDYINIASSFTETDQAYVFSLRDDGEGLDQQKILVRAQELGMISAENVESSTLTDAVKMIFRSGFSSNAEADLDGGRGVGLDVVHQLIKKNGGRISVSQKQGQFCQFKISFPK